MHTRYLLCSSLLVSAVLGSAVACDSTSDGSPHQGGAGEGGAASGGTASGGAASGGGAAGMGGGGGVDSTAFRGRVVDGAGAGVAGARVLIEGQGQLYETAADGSFEVEGVPDTYDLIVLPAGGEKVVSIWQNATLRQPTAIVPVEHEVPRVRVSGRITRDADLPSVAGTVTHVGFDCADGRRVPAQEVTSDEFEIDVSWARWGNASCKLLALEGELRGEEYTRLTAFASRVISLKDGDGPKRGQDLELRAVATTEVAVRHDYVTPSFEYTRSFQWGPFAEYFEHSFTNPSVLMWKVHVPDVTVPIWAEVGLDGSQAKKRGIGGGLVLMDMSKEIRRLSPPDAESIPPDGEFSILVSPLLPAGIYQFDYLLPSGARLVLHTTEETFRLPDLSPLGVELSGSTTWSGTYSLDATSVDALLEAYLLPDFSNTTPEQTFTFDGAL